MTRKYLINFAKVKPTNTAKPKVKPKATKTTKAGSKAAPQAGSKVNWSSAGKGAALVGAGATMGALGSMAAAPDSQY